MTSLPAKTFVHSGLDADSMARDQLFAQFAPLVRRLIRQYGNSKDMQEDLVGEIYCRFYALLESYDASRGVPLRPYIVRQLTLATFTYARQQWRIQKRDLSRKPEEDPADQATAFDPTGDWLASLAQDQVAALLPCALEKLPARQRNVVMWRYYEERSFEEIAEILGVKPTTVRSMLRHAINRLRQTIGTPDCL